MIRMMNLRLLGAVAVTLAACSSDNGTIQTTNGEVKLSVVNALAAAGSGAQLNLDQARVSLPGTGQAASLTVTSGMHRIQLSSASGQSLVDTIFSAASGSRPTVVLSGAGAVAIATDTISVGSSGTGYHSIVGSVLFVNSAANAGPFDVVVYQAHSDSVYRFGGFAFGSGSLPPPAPYGFYVPFEPATYTVTVTSPGGTTALATTNLTLATDDRWTVMLTTSAGGGLVLQAVKQ